MTYRKIFYSAPHVTRLRVGVNTADRLGRKVLQYGRSTRRVVFDNFLLFIYRTTCDGSGFWKLSESEILQNGRLSGSEGVLKYGRPSEKSGRRMWWRLKNLSINVFLKFVFCYLRFSTIYFKSILTEVYVRKKEI